MIPSQVNVRQIPNPSLPIKEYIRECIRLGLKPSEAFYHYFTQHQIVFGLFRTFMKSGGGDLITELGTPLGQEWLEKDNNLNDFFSYLITIGR